MSFGSIAAASGEATRVRAAIGTAAQQTGMSFSYLLAQANSESGLNPAAHAASSSAGGLYQFLDSSWLGVVKQHGASYGLGWAAQAIEAKPGGGYTVPDPSLRKAIMALREQPETSALMAGAYAADNAAGLGQALGRAPTGADLYMAHFLGLSGATKFLKAADANPTVSAAALFPHEAAANRSIFFDADGSSRSLAGVQAIMTRKLGHGAGALTTMPAATNAEDDYARAQAQFALASTTGDAERAITQASLTGTAAALSATGGGASLLRPNPATARLAYLLLTTMGTNPPA